MATNKPYHGGAPTVMFKAPTVGPHMYLAEGTISGWPEAFDRAEADRALVDFIAPLEMAELAPTFDTAIKLEARGINWSDITGFLAKITGQPEDLVPTNVAVAFWAQYLLFETQQGTN
ncbi:MAG: hypothetical protein ACREJC_03985 [Tepidisphaeraceae bacterium]